MAEVYWIHLPEHTDMFSEGYIGVTRNNAKERFKSHINAANLNKKKHLKISYAIKKYGAENLIVETLVICSDEYALDLEIKLRPTSEIGWNLAPGGSKPPVRVGPMGPEFSARLSERNRGIPKSEETKRKISETLTGTTLPQEVKNRISEAHKLKIAKDGVNANSIRAMREGTLKNRRNVVPETSFWINFRKNSTKLLTVTLADQAYNYFIEKDKLVTAKDVTTFIGLDDSWGNVTHMRTLLQYFSSGWNPSEDICWLTDFNKEAVYAPQSA